MALCALVGLALLAGLGSGLAWGERSQRGNLIVSLDGDLSPLKLPRQRPAPVSIHLEGGLATADGAPLPRVTRIELGLPGQGVLDTEGLPSCPARRLRNATPADAREACGPALVGDGRLRAVVPLPHQKPFAIEAELLAFNSQDRAGRRAVLMYAFAARPPTVVAVPFVLRRGDGRLGTTLAADLSSALGPWPHLTHFALTLSRRYSYRGESHSFLSASCPIPRRFTAGFFSFARASFTFADGKRIGTGIARGCRAR